MTTGPQPAERVDAEPAGEPPLPTIAEQVAEQLGGWRGMVESSIPVIIFVLVNVLADLRPALIASLAVAVAIAVMRLLQRRPVRHAVNGLFGIGVGAFIAYRSGDSKDFYLPGILYGIAYGLVLLGSAAIRQPLVGWIWSVFVAGGKSEWRQDGKLVRTFTWLTVLWGVVWLAKVGVQAALYLADQDTALGVARLVLGYPPYLLLLAITVWTVRRVTRDAPPVPSTATSAG
ncbi:DUF3159 domain-containing protein [Micromonospora sp. NPDC050397]|uniref:DUF3159 domain-containing protein n=1 Tax=Micromonospora sp. NPDC050397 TaxID=3364279 RepID=UPI00384CB0EC